MRIGVYVPGVNKSSGGAYTFEYGILTSLLNYKDDENIFVFSHYDDLRFKDTKINYIKLPRVNVIKAKWRMNKDLSKSKHYISLLDKEVKERQIDILWCASQLFEPVDIPYVYTVWDIEHLIYPFFPEVSVGGEWDNREKLYGNRIKRATYIFTGTQTGKNEIVKFYNVMENKITVIPYPSPDYSNISEKKVAGISGDYLFYPATYFPHKNHIRILEALLILEKQYNLKLSAVFSGFDAGNKDYIISKCREFNLSDRVHILDFITTEELVYLYKNAAALVFASHFGPDNIPPLEAFSLKCPVIASRVYGTEEQLGKNALLVDPDNSEDFASAILKIMTDKSFKEEMVLNAYNFVSKWTFDDYTEKALSTMLSFNAVRSSWGHNYDKYYKKDSILKKAVRKLLKFN